MHKVERISRISKNMLTKIRDKIESIQSNIQDHHKNKYVTYSTAFKNWYKFKNVEYELYDLEGVIRFKTSDTIFVLGSGPSLNLVSQSHINTISKNDSFGINLSFLKKEIVPTFHQMSYERNLWVRDTIVEKLSPKRKIYNNTVFFLNDKAYRRFGHPRITPYFYSEKPKCCLYKLPKPILLERQRPFANEDFDKTLYYRGTISLVLDLILKLGYKNIVLLGVDLDVYRHFYDEMEEMKVFVQRMYQGYEKAGHKEKFESMYPKGAKLQPFDVYLYALKDYLQTRRKVSLFVGFKNNMLYPEIPAYFD